MTCASSGRDGTFRLSCVVVRVFAALASTCCLAGAAHAQAGSRPNIVLFYVDDLRHDGLGVTGHPFVETPNLDRRIAGQGVNFRNSFVNCPLCSPSRASLLTGQYAVTHGYTVNDDVNAVPDERLPIFQHTLRGAGYRTGHVGKWHKDSYVEPRPGFDYWVAFHGQGVHTDPQLRVKEYDAPVRTVNETGFTTNVLTEYALDFLDDYGTGGSRAEPFALTLSFKAVHGPHGDQYTQSGGAYAGQTIDRPPNARPDYGGYSINQEKPVYSLPGLNGLTLNNTMGNSQQISQMEMMKDIDANIGRVLDALEAKGLDDNTLVIFTSDNGFFWGEHGRGDKRLAYDESIRVPLLMRGPGVQGGRTSDALVTNIDLAPTILTAAGLPVPRSMQGQPLNGLLSGSGGPARDAVFAEYYPEVKQPGIQRWDAVRTETHLYVTHPLAGTQYDELYDMVEDPYQMNNLLLPGPADTLPAGTRQVLQQMQTRLVELRQEANSVNPFTRQLISGDAVTDFTVTTSGLVRSDATAARVGSNTDIAGGGNGRSAVLAFELPTIDDPALLERAFVSFHIVQQTGNVSTVNADLWAIGITDENTRLAEHLNANTELGLADRADNVKLQDNIISLGQAHLARTFSNDAAASVLAEYLRDFYEANPRYAGGRFLQVRLNPDRDLGATSIGWDISTMEAPTSSTDPRPFTFRQPALSMQFTAVPEPAALTWYGDGVNPGGDGTWTTTGTTWFDGTTVRPWVPGAKAIFSGSAGTIALGPGVLARGGLEFRSTGFTLAGSGLTLGGTAGGTVEVAGGVTATIASILSGTSGLVKTGVGTLALGAANAFTGTARVDQGTLLVTNTGALAASPIVVRTSGTLKLPGDSRLVLAATSLTVDQATGGTVDVGKGRITIASGGTTEADLRADLLAGRSGGTWSGTSGIVTTGGPAGAATQPVVGYRVFASGSAVVAWAAPGDANLDGQVNLTDVSLINNGGGFSQGASTAATWVQGDFNYSGGVTLTDIALLNNSGLYGKGSYLPVAGLGSLSGTTLVASVPEPGACGLAIMGLMAAVGMIRRGRWHF